MVLRFKQYMTYSLMRLKAAGMPENILRENAKYLQIVCKVDCNLKDKGSFPSDDGSPLSLLIT